MTPPRRVLVTGAAGLLGSATLRLLADRGIAATALDRREPDQKAADRTVVGEVTDTAVVRDALDGVDAVIHCAAIPAPSLDTPERVFGRNSLATFVVLDEAGRAGIGRAMLASSQSIYGLAFAPVPLLPLYLPIDDAHPLQVADPYALSKQADEATGVMIARRYGMTVVALRYPFIGDLGGRVPALAATQAADPAIGASSLWAYLEERDAARAALLAVTAPLTGYHVFGLAAPETLVARPTGELLDRYLPEVPRRRPMPGREVPIDLGPAADLLGFRAEHHYQP